MESFREWKQLGSNEKDHMFHCQVSGSSLEVLVTDGKSIFQEILLDNDILGRCNELNPAIEAEASDLAEEIKILLEAKSTFVQLDTTEKELWRLQLQGKVFDFNFGWHFHLEKKSEAEFSHVILQETLRAMEHLLNEQEKLIQTIKAKDLEIADLYHSGANLTRQSLKTKPFDETLDLLEVLKVPGDPLQLLCSPRYHSVLHRLSKAKVADEDEQEILKQERRKRFKIRPNKGAADLLNSNNDDDECTEERRTSQTRGRRLRTQDESHVKPTESKRVAKRLKKL